jgi:endonuclease IV
MSANFKKGFSCHVYKATSDGGVGPPDIAKCREYAAERGIELTAVQIFVIGPDDSRAVFRDTASMHVFRDDSAGTAVIIHGSHLDHLIGTRPHFTKINIRRELEIGAEIGARGLVIHLPRAGPKRTIELVRDIVPAGCPLTIFLEIPSHNYPDSYARPENLAKLARAIRRAGAGTNASGGADIKLGIAIDTAHLWAAGVDIETRIAARQWISEVDLHGIPLVLHLNDQTYPFGSGSDKHAAIGTGTIWHTSDGWREFVKLCAEHDAAAYLIMERGTLGKKDLAILKELSFV